MGMIRKYGNKIERFIASDSGQQFFNFAYSIGAAIVIWGALFKLLHMKGGELLLSIGMGTEVVMFILAAFDRPPKPYRWEEVFPELDGRDGSREKIVERMSATRKIPAMSAPVAQVTPSVAVAEDVSPELFSANDAYLAQLKSAGEQLRQLGETAGKLNAVQQTIISSYDAVLSNKDVIKASAEGYAEQMQALSRNISGLNTIYEIQLKSISGQLDAIDRVNKGIKEIRDMYERSAEQSTRYVEETEKMARHIEQLNHVYEKMLHAMTVNMYNPVRSETATSTENMK